MRAALPRLVLCFLLLAGARLAAFQSLPATLISLREANELRKVQRYEEARAIYEKLHREQPDDGQVSFELGYTLYLEGCGEGDSARGTELRKQAHQLGQQAVKLGYSDVLLDMLVSAVDAQGRDLRTGDIYSPKPEANAAVKQAEQLYAQGRMDEALTLYQKALALDPQAYSAALFGGDVFFSKKDFAQAMEWFAQAAKINPNRETAYRYWGDALMQLGRVEEAREKYLNALVAEPYNRLPRDMLAKHASATRLQLKHPAVTIPRVQIKFEGEKPSISYDPAGGPLVLAYAVARVKWVQEDRPKYFPKSSPIRHSLPEEVAALKTLATVAEELGAKDPQQVQSWSETVATLKSLERSGFLEAYVLLDRPDQEIALDYPAYREQHRAELLRYVREIWLGLK